MIQNILLECFYKYYYSFAKFAFCQVNPLVFSFDKHVSRDYRLSVLVADPEFVIGGGTRAKCARNFATTPPND